MREQRLSERALAGEKAASVGVDTSALLEDVLGHLQELFNVRQGSVPIRLDYGMPDFNDIVHEFPDAINVLRNEIERQIMRFEPRLRDVSVRHLAADDDGHALSFIFRITATLASEGAAPVTVETEVGSNGLVKVAA